MAGNGAGGPSIDLLTVTRLWNFPQRVYAVGKIRLAAIFGRGLSVRMFGYALVVGLPILGVAWLLALPWEGLGVTVRFVVPAVVVWVALRYAADGGAPGAFVRDVTQLGVSTVVALVGRLRGTAPESARPVRVVHAVRAGSTRVVYGVQQPRTVGAASVVWAAGVIFGGGRTVADRARAGVGPLVAEDRA